MTMKSTEASDSNIKMGLANLHDAFLQASLQRKHMEISPIATDPIEFMISDRGRFERVWIALLYVLVEAWQADQHEPIREYVRSLASTEELERLLAQGGSDGSIARMREARNYVCHRDKREYWDPGRLAVAGGLQYHISLHDSFSEIFLLAMRKTGSAT